MDDDLYALGPQTIQRLKKSSKEISNQTNTPDKLMRLSSQGEQRKNMIGGRNYEGKTH